MIVKNVVAIGLVTGVLVGPAAIGRPAPAAAATVGPGRSTPEYHVRIDVQDNGTIDVVERIAFDFGTDEGHGIFRDIFTQRAFDKRHTRRYRFHLVSVTTEPAGTPNRTERSTFGDTIRLRIGAPDRLVTGLRTYTIRYRLNAAVNRTAAGPELYWNAIGPDWQFSIADARVEVHSAAARRRPSTCFAGAIGSTGGCSARDDGSTSVFTARDLAPGGALTVVVGFAPGALHPVAPDIFVPFAWSRAFPVTPATAAGAALTAALSLLGLGRLLQRGRDRRFAGSPIDAAMGGTTGETLAPLIGREPHPVEFVPPDDLRPAQLALLIRESVRPVDVTATIIDLARRGHLSIEELPATNRHAKPDWQLTRTSGRDDLNEYEQPLLDQLFAAGGTITLSQLENTFSSELNAVMTAIASDGVQRGWWKRSPTTTKAIWFAVGVAALALSIGLTLALGRVANAGFVGAGAIPAALGLLVGARTMPSRTATGHALAGRADGFRQLFTDAESRRQQFAERTGVFLEYMGYAIAFGCTAQWAKAFAGLAVEPPDWYHASHGAAGVALFDTQHFTTSMSSFAESGSATLASTPGDSSSSGFSGGSSGGGGGGGGGGSW